MRLRLRTQDDYINGFYKHIYDGVSHRVSKCFLLSSSKKHVSVSLVLQHSLVFLLSVNQVISSEVIFHLVKD